MNLARLTAKTGPHRTLRRNAAGHAERTFGAIDVIVAEAYDAPQRLGLCDGVTVDPDGNVVDAHVLLDGAPGDTGWTWLPARHVGLIGHDTATRLRRIHPVR